MIWNIDPILYDFGRLKLSWYGLLFAGGFLVGVQLMQWIYRREGRDVRELDRLLWYVLAGTLIGMRLMHCLVYEPERFLAHPIDILKIWQGGYASHGGAIGLLLAVYLYCRPADRPNYMWLLDRLAIPAVLAGAFIRVGNFFNSEILGNPTASPLGVVFLREDNVPRHPVQLYEAIAYVAIFVLLLQFYRRGVARRSGFITGMYLVTVFVARFLLEFLKTPQATYESGATISVGQYLSVPFILAGIALLVWSYRSKPNAS